MRRGGDPAKIADGTGDHDDDESRRASFRRYGDHGVSGHAWGDRVDDPELTDRVAVPRRLVLPYLMIMLCLILAAWLIWRLLWSF
jgi:hypothetical protein